MTDPTEPSPDGMNLGEWLQGEGPQSDIAICTRVRFARNVEGFRFSTSMTDEEACQLTEYLRDQLCQEGFTEKLSAVDVSKLEETERRMLIERHLISRELASASRDRCVVLNDDESVSVMINEEDHIRAQVFASGFRIGAAYRRAEALDEDLMGRVPVAFSEEFGFLTACPTNTGTGLRVSVMLHLPGLVWAEDIDKAVNSAQKIHMAVRGLYGEGSRALGDFYQVSNQVTLGRSEEQILGDVGSAVERIIDWEREIREALTSGDKMAQTEDRVHRSLGTLERARILTSEEALTCLSAVRFGLQQGLLEHLTLDQINRALLLSQPAHLQRLCHATLSPGERDLRRATLIRQALGQH